MANNLKLVVMDMAGTTIRDDKEVETCFAQAAKETGLEMTPEEITAIQGWGKEYVFRTFWKRQEPHDEVEAERKAQISYETFRTILEDHYLNSPVVLTEGCEDILHFFKDHNILSALTTGFYRKVTNILLHKAGWLDMLNADMTGKPGSLISFSITSEEVQHGRPAPDMIFAAMKKLNVHNLKEVINIGDTPSDLESGIKAGVELSVGLINGTHTRVQLEACPNNGLFDSLSDFQTYLQTLLESDRL